MNTNPVYICMMTKIQLMASFGSGFIIMIRIKALRIPDPWNIALCELFCYLAISSLQLYVDPDHSTMWIWILLIVLYAPGSGK